MGTDRKPTDEDSALLGELRAQTAWLRFLSLQSLRPLLSRLKDRERLAYELSDGQRSSRAVGQAANCSKTSVTTWWADWIAAGIAVDAGDGRAKRLVSLGELGFQIPKVVSLAPTGQEGADDGGE